MRTRSGRSGGVVLGVAAGVLLGSLTVSGKPLSLALSAPGVAALTYLVAGLLVGTLRVVLPRVAPSLARPLRSDGPWQLPSSMIGRARLSGSVLFGAFLGPLLLFAGLSQTTAGAAAVVLTAEVALTVVAAVVLLQERVRPLQGMGVAIVLAATVGLTVSARLPSGGLGSGIGDLLVLGAASSFAIDNTLTKGLATAEDQLGTIAVKAVAGGALLAVVVFVLGAPLLPPVSLWPMVVAAGGLGVGASLICYLAAVDRIGTLQATVLLATSGLCGALLAAGIGQEPLDRLALIGGVAVIGGVALLLRAEEGPVIAPP